MWAFTRSLSEEPLKVSSAFQQNVKQFLTFAAKEMTRKEKQRQQRKHFLFQKKNSFPLRLLCRKMKVTCDSSV